MQADLHDFLVRLARTVVLTLMPVALIAFLTMPSSMHSHTPERPLDPNTPLEHMS